MELDAPIRVGVIGAGLFGSNLIDQVERVAGMETAAVADVDREKAARSLERSGLDDEVHLVGDTAEADAAIADGDRAVLGDGVDLARADVDVVVEATGIPEVGARHAFVGITAGTHVVMVTVEADTVVGPLLSRLAERNGVTYSMAYGDQPALIVELCDWARTVGFDVVAAGKWNPYLAENHHATPEDVFERIEFDEAFVERQNLNPRMYNSFFDGTKVAVEMCAVANATGLEPDVPRMHLPTAEVPEMPAVLRPKEEGGILEGTGVVETVSSLYPDGSSVERDLSLGVFVVTTTPDQRVREYLDQYAGTGLYTADDGKYQLFYRPYHLPGLETTVSVANAALRNEPTGTPRERVGEVVAAAKRPLEPGDELDGGGGYTVYGALVDAGTADEKGYVPFELLDGATITGKVDTDGIVTYEKVELDTDSFLYHLREIQNSTL